MSDLFESIMLCMAVAYMTTVFCKDCACREKIRHYGLWAVLIALLLSGLNAYFKLVPDFGFAKFACVIFLLFVHVAFLLRNYNFSTFSLSTMRLWNKGDGKIHSRPDMNLNEASQDNKHLDK